MATLRIRKFKGGIIYYVDFTYQGKRYRKSTKTKDRKLAELFLKDVEVKIAKEGFGEVGKHRIAALGHMIGGGLEPRSPIHDIRGDRSRRHSYRVGSGLFRSIHHAGHVVRRPGPHGGVHSFLESRVSST